jgi:hypothetical protein
MCIHLPLCLRLSLSLSLSVYKVKSKADSNYGNPGFSVFGFPPADFPNPILSPRIREVCLGKIGNPENSNSRIPKHF